MKKLLSFLLLLIALPAVSQVPSFKIVNVFSSINESTATDSLLKPGENIYKTLEIIEYNYCEMSKKEKKSKLDSLLSDLYQNSAGKTTPAYTKEQVKAKKNEIETLEKEIEQLASEQDSLYHLYVKDLLLHRRFTAFPGQTRSRAFFDLAYGNTGERFKLLNNTGFTFGNNTSSIYSEIASGDLGVFRVSLGAMLSNSSSDSLQDRKEEEAFQRLVSYGGNTVLTFEYPMIYAHSRDSKYNFISRFLVKGTADLPEFGTTTEKWAGSASAGIDLYADATVSNNSMKFFANFNLAGVTGTSTFRDNLGVDNKQFLFGQLTAGLVLAQNIKISFIISTISSESNLENKNVIAGGQILH